MLILFQLLIYFLIAPSFFIMDFKIKRKARHLFICSSLRCLQGEGPVGKGYYLLASAASKLRDSLRAKCLHRETQMLIRCWLRQLALGFKISKNRNPCSESPRSFRATTRSCRGSEFTVLLFVPPNRAFIAQRNESHSHSVLRGPESRRT